jgi:hypothetical protein
MKLTYEEKLNRQEQAYRKQLKKRQQAEERKRQKELRRIERKRSVDIRKAERKHVAEAKHREIADRKYRKEFGKRISRADTSLGKSMRSDAKKLGIGRKSSVVNNWGNVGDNPFLK